MRLALPPAVHAVALAARRRLGESRLLWSALVCATALLAAWLVHDVQHDAERLRDAWGEGVPALVARRDVQPGEPLDPAAVEVDVLPRAAVPPGALAEMPDPGEVAVVPIHAGEVVHEARVGPDAGGLAPLLPPGTVGIAVPVDAAAVAALALSPGTEVDVLATDPVTGQPSLGAAGARVVAVSETMVVVAVPAAAAPVAAAASAAGAGAVLVLRAPR